MQENKALLEQLLAAQVLVLEQQIRAEKATAGSTRLGGDYTQEALNLLQSKSPELIARMHQMWGWA
jgi:hypothetical protein